MNKPAIPPDTVSVALAKDNQAVGRLSQLRNQLGGLGIGAIIVVTVIGVSALLAPWIAPFDPYQGSITDRHLAPSMTHWFGTDQSGRDIFSRILWGARNSLNGPVIVVIVTAILGCLTALAAVWFGGRVDSFIGRVLDVLFSFPNMLLAILAVAIFGPSVLTASIALAIGYMPYTARVIRSVALRERNLPYVKSAELQGINGAVITVRHILPNVSNQILTGMTINFGYAMIDIAALSFLGLAIQPPEADWGLMVSNGQGSLQQGFWEQSIFAGIAIVVTVAAFGYIGERLGGRQAAGRTK